MTLTASGWAGLEVKVGLSWLCQPLMGDTGLVGCEHTAISLRAGENEHLYFWAVAKSRRTLTMGWRREGKGLPVHDHTSSVPNPWAWEGTPKRGSKGQGGKSHQKSERIKATKGGSNEIVPGIKNASNEVN